LAFLDKEKPTGFICFIDVEGNGFQDANTTGNEIISEFLDALSFIMKSSLFLMEIAVALKDEKGSAKRVAYRNTTKDSLPNPLYLQDETADSVRKILSEIQIEGHYDLSLRWLRYSYRARTWTEKFVNEWLAFERLLGEKQIERKCPQCGKELPSYPSVDKKDAYNLLLKYHPKLDEKSFKTIWKARQRMFHGGGLDTAFMKILAELSPKISTVVEGELVEKYKPNKKLSIERPNTVARESKRDGFYEFTAEDPKAIFAMNYPTDEQLLEFEKEDSVCSKYGFELLSAEEKIKENW
jgi:hypothetical protein